MKFVIHPAVEPERLEALRTEAPDAEWVNAADRASAARRDGGNRCVPGQDYPGPARKGGPPARWVQAFTVSLEHYIFPELVAHSSVLTNMARSLWRRDRGPGDGLRDQLRAELAHVRPAQVEHRYEPVGGEAARVQ